MERCWACILTMRRSVSGESGHDALLAAACTCFRFGLNIEQARVIMMRFNAERCDPPWSEAEIERKLVEGSKKVEEDGQFGELLRKKSTGAGKSKHWHNHLPEWIHSIPRLRPYQRVILQAIADRCDHLPIDAHGSLGTAIMGYKKLAKLCVMGDRTCKRHVKSLIAMGALVRINKGGVRFETGECLANTYCIPGHFGALDGVPN